MHRERGKSVKLGWAAHALTGFPSHAHVPARVFVCVRWREIDRTVMAAIRSEMLVVYDANNNREIAGGKQAFLSVHMTTEVLLSLKELS